MSTKPTFTRYQVFIIVLISLLQFTVILDFMVMAPLGAMLIRILKITPSQFGWVVSVYAFSAGILIRFLPPTLIPRRRAT